MPPDWIDDYCEEEYLDFDEYYEAMAEKEDIDYEDRVFERMNEEEK